MPRFGMKSLLVATAVIALWLSTLTGYTGGDDVRRSIMLLILIASAIAAVYGNGRRRAFWIGFFVVILLLNGGNHIYQVMGWTIPRFNWADAVTRDLMGFSGFHREGRNLAIYETIRVVNVLLLAGLAGYVAAYIYDQSQQNKDG